MKHILVYTLSLIAVAAFAQPTDKQIRDRAEAVGFKALPKLKGKNEAIFKLGERLYFDKNLSGNRNISCASCHHPKFYSGDGLMLGLGQGRIETPDGTHQGNGALLKRHSPHVINLGYKRVDIMFWDGRLTQNRVHGYFTTPVEGLNGPNPKYKEIVSQLGNSLEAQAIFPILSRDEMRGHIGENELAADVPVREVWKRIVARIRSDKKYDALIERAFPNQKFHIGHVGKAIGHFEAHFFASNESPFDRYMAGDDKALSPTEKLGMWTFMLKGRCISCHNGAHLGNNQLRGAGAPQLSSHKFEDDIGQGEFSERHQYFFKVAPLRNVSLTAPYFHNGAFSSLKEVIEHYDDIKKSINNYRLDSSKTAPYTERITVESDPDKNILRRRAAHPIRTSLNFTSREKEALLKFLEVSLTDMNFKRRMDSYIEPVYK